MVMWMGEIGKVVSFDIPSKVGVNQVVDAKVRAKVTMPMACIWKFAVGVGYDDGPIDAIEYFNGSEWKPLRKGEVAVVVFEMAYEGETYEALIKLRFPKEGTYKVSGIEGTSNGTVTVDDRVTKEITVTGGAPYLIYISPTTLMASAMGATIGAIGGYALSKNAKGAIAGAVAGGGIGYTATVLKDALPQILPKGKK